jgi:hypothetical protein
MAGDKAVAPIACIILLREKFGFAIQTSGSEQYADPKLNGSWTGPAQHLAKLRCADSHAGASSQAEYGVVENVEELGAQLDLIGLADRLIPDERHVEVSAAIIAQARLGP